MKMKIVALVLVISMVLSACGTKGDSKKGTEENQGNVQENNGNQEGNEVTTAPKADLSEKLSYTIFSQADDDPEFTLDNNAVIQYWKDMFNIEVKWQLPPQGSEQEQLNLMLGTGDYTDVIDVSFSTENLATLYEDGVIYELSEYIEAYMPNYNAFLNKNEDVKSALYDDEGRIYNIAVIKEEPLQWGGLIYRKDILEIMTGGNIAFPSGSEEPSTIEDWEYMLPLMKQYFDMAGMNEYACLIIPACGYFATGELMAGFGIGGTDYVDDSGKVRYGIAEDQFYNYLAKMKEWYEAGYIYSDFASRYQDLFYLPNTALTYGGAAGIWFGFTAQLGGSMSIPDYGLYMDTAPLAAPADTASGIEKPLGVYLDSGRVTSNGGWVVSTACSKDKLIRILSAFDYFYSEEGACTRTMGLSSEQGAADVEGYVKNGMEGGTRKPDSREWTDAMNEDAAREVTDYAANRMPGIEVAYPPRECDLIDGVDIAAVGDSVWTSNGNQNVFPLTVTFTPEETSEINKLSTYMKDYADSMIAKFIMGREELTLDTFKAYQEKLKTLGLESYLSLKQAAYERYLAR